jgi:hypothetical protein
LNKSCPVSRLRVVRHNRTKYRESGPREQSCFYLCFPCMLQHTFWIFDGEWTPHGALGGRHRRLRHRSWALPDFRHRLLGGPTVVIFVLSGGRSQISITVSKGPTIDVFTLSGGHSQISVTSSLGVCHRCFHVKWWAVSDSWHRLPGGRHQHSHVMWWALSDPRHHLSGEPTIDVSYNGGGCSQTLDITFQGPTIDISDNGGGCSWTTGIASHGAYHRRL